MSSLAERPSQLTICGAGPAGLTLALLCTRAGLPVTLIERDSPAPAPSSGAEHIVQEWGRAGVPHARQGHIFLARGVCELHRRLPDVLDRLTRLGAVLVPVDDQDPTQHYLLSRRLVWESALAEAAAQEPGITRLQGSVQDLEIVTCPDGEGHVEAIQVAGVDPIPVEFVVDAMGRRSPLRRIGVGGEESQPCGFHYICRGYRASRGEFPSTRVPQVSTLPYLSALVFPADNSHFQISLAIGSDDPLRHDVLHPAVFEAVLAQLPALQPWLAIGTPTTKPTPMAGLENRWRPQMVDTQPSANNLVAIGDAWIQTNPTAGRGTTLALLQASRLADALLAGEQPVAKTLEDWAQHEIRDLFDAQIEIDRGRIAELHAGQQGETAPGSFSPVAARFAQAVETLGHDRRDVRAAGAHMFHLLATPADALSDRAMAVDIARAMRAEPLPAQGPSRAEFEATVAAAVAQQGGS